MTVPVTADEVVMTDGARLTGRVAHKAGDKLTFTTSYAGEIEINWGDIRTLSTDGPVDVLLVGDEEPIRVILEPSSEGGVHLQGIRVALIDIMYINPTPDEAGDSILYNGNAKVSVSSTRGNARSEQAYVDSDLAARSTKYRVNLLGKYNAAHEGAEQTKTAANWLVSGNVDRFLDDEQFVYMRSSLERDRFKDVERRFTIGAGYGVQLIETQRSNVSLRGGIDAVTARRRIAEDERYPAFGWGIHATHKLVGRTELFHDQDGFRNLESSGQTTIRSRTGLRIPLFAKLNASVQLNVDWESKPPSDRKSTDLVWLVGLGYSW